MDPYIAANPAFASLSAPPPVSISFEIFPPKTEAGAEKLWETVEKLSAFHPQFISVTCGAGGSAIDGTSSVVQHIRTKLGLDTAPHVAIARQSRSRVRDALRAYKANGVRRVVAIRGDEAQCPEQDFGTDVYNNTIEFVHELKHEFDLDPIVAAYPDVHPKALSEAQDLDHLRRKADAGATFAVSQFFFHPETFLRFRDKLTANGITLPMAAGIMPIQNLAQVVKFAGGCGTIVPDGFCARFEKHGVDTDSLFLEGVAHSVELCDQLRREGVNQFHFYTLNRADMTSAVCTALGFETSIATLATA